ncbi:alpha/beta hydrolase [Pedobacter yulinensis]|uniref:Alpha/beta hydrolase n=1 Tax=Pedobacter yulinensis TaxID=2126353 RepID=A0A2T3HMA0_9SPHI|nr:alpha/beta hydrolase [Pedobacter yulinensis]PST83588.1 alpha/beta hydrolase [Pedobacter yulinensis]
MKRLKALMTEIGMSTTRRPKELLPLVWQLICYPPKMPVRPAQQQLLEEALTTWLSVPDPHFARRDLRFPVYQWGSGPKTILLSHGWGSKASDFSELIGLLRTLPEVRILAFDAPGNGLAEGELSNLLLFKQSFREVALQQKGAPRSLHAVIGHSLGAMAAVLAVPELPALPRALVSLAPMVRLKANFVATLESAGIPPPVQQLFLKEFEARFGLPATAFDLPENDRLPANVQHHLFYDPEDPIAPGRYQQELLQVSPHIEAHMVSGCGHHKILNHAGVLKRIIDIIALA